LTLFLLKKKRKNNEREKGKKESTNSVDLTWGQKKKRPSAIITEDWRKEITGQRRETLTSHRVIKKIHIFTFWKKKEKEKDNKTKELRKGGQGPPTYSTPERGTTTLSPPKRRETKKKAATENWREKRKNSSPHHFEEHSAQPFI